MLDGSLRRERNHPQCRRVQWVSEAKGSAISRTAAVRGWKPRAASGIHTDDRPRDLGRPRDSARALRIDSRRTLCYGPLASERAQNKLPAIDANRLARVVVTLTRGLAVVARAGYGRNQIKEAAATFVDALVGDA